MKIYLFLTWVGLCCALISTPADAVALRVITQDSIPDSCYRGNREAVIAMVNRAVELVDAVGPGEAFRQFMQPDGGYIRGDLYIFVLNPAGTLLANGANPRSVGNNVLLAQDGAGHYFVKSMLRQALSEGKGWVDYEWISPCTRELATKSSYCRKTGQFVICTGIYHSQGSSRIPGKLSHPAAETTRRLSTRPNESRLPDVPGLRA